MNQSIPLIDIQKTDAAKNLGKALKEVGLARLQGHHIPLKAITELYEAASSIFQKSDDELMRYFDHTDGGGNDGFFPYKKERALGKKPGSEDLKRFFHIHRDFRLCPGEMTKPAQLVFTACEELSFKIARLIANYLHLPDEYFVNMIEGGNNLLRVLHYPEVPNEVDEKTNVRAATHTDINWYTLLLPPYAKDRQARRGLQIRRRNPNRWVEVEHEANEVIIQTSDMLKTHTKWLHDFGFIKQSPFASTPHRVMNMPGERLSLPFFVHPRGSVRLMPNMTAGDFLNRRLRAIAIKK